MIANKRDLGGIRTKNGESIKTGCLVRSANTSQAEEGDLQGISTILDLRTPQEREEMPDKTCGREYLTIPVFEELTAGISHEDGADENGIFDMRAMYRGLVGRCAGSFAKILGAIMDHDYASGAILWHCSEGKDRGGLTAALVLEVLGVDRDTIMEDYLKTNEVNLPKAEGIREQLKATRGEEFAEAIYRAYIADRTYLESAWDAMGPDYIGTLDIPAEKINRFRETLLDRK